MNQIKFTKGAIRFNKKEATISIPIGIAKELYADATGTKDVFFSVIGGVLQASVGIPDCSIPSLVLNKDLFMPQKPVAKAMPPAAPVQVAMPAPPAAPLPKAKLVH